MPNLPTDPCDYGGGTGGGDGGGGTGGGGGSVGVKLPGVPGLPTTITGVSGGSGSSGGSFGNYVDNVALRNVALTYAQAFSTILNAPNYFLTKVGFSQTDIEAFNTFFAVFGATESLFGKLSEAAGESSAAMEGVTNAIPIKIGTADDGWSILYQDKEDGRYWELTYPESGMHGGGPPTLTWLKFEEVEKKYKISPTDSNPQVR